MKKWLTILAVAMTLIFVTACGSGNNEPNGNNNASSGNNVEENNAEENNDNGVTEDGESFTIGVSQFVEHPSLDAAYAGFQAAIKDAGLNVEYDFQNAQADQNNTATIASNLVGKGVDLIFANATPSAAGVFNATTEIPIVFASVSDPIAAGFVESFDQADKTITGVVDLHPEFTEKTIQFIEDNFTGAKVGLIYNTGEQNSVAQVKSIEEIIAGTSLELVTRSVSTSADVQQAAQSLVGEVEVILVTTDNTVVNALEAVIQVANDNKIPMVVGETDSLERGGFATYGVDFFAIGYRAGEMAVSILKGEGTTASIPIETPPEMPLYINKKAAELQGVEWNDEWDKIAEIVE